MSPRFQRRPDRRSGAGGDSPGRYAERPGRPADRSAPARRGWGGSRSEWRSDGAADERRPQRRAGAERPRPRQGERAGQWRSSDRPAGERRPLARRDDRRMDRRSRGDQPRFEPRRESRPLAIPQGEAETLGSTPPSDLIWGRHPAEAALESGRPIHRIWCTADMRHSARFLQLLREAKASGVLVEEVTWARLAQLTGGAVHQGIVLQSAAADTLDLASLIDGCSQIGEPPLLMAIDGLTDPHNLGAIVRSAEALGAHGMVLPQRRCAGLTGSVAKVAAGALEHLPVARVVNLNRALESLKQEGYRVIGLAAEGTLTLEQADLEGPLVVVTGSEGDGLSMLTRRHCDQLVRIPLRGSTPSLNASVATALLLYEIARRGWMRGLSGQAPAPRLQRPQLPSPPEPTAKTATEPAAAQSEPADTRPEPERAAAEPAATDPLPEQLPVAQPAPLPDPSPWAEVAAAPADSNGQGFSSDISL